MLFQRERHEPINAPSWSESIAQDAILRIAQESRAAYTPDGLFPAHPMDESQDPHLGSGHYFGAGGVFWALSHLESRGATEVDSGWIIDQLTQLLTRFPQEAQMLGNMQGVTSFLFGDLPILIQLYNLTGDSHWRAQIVDRVRSSTQDPVRELMWGTPGILTLTHQISDLVLAEALGPYDHMNLESLINKWEYDYNGLCLWKEELYGSHHFILGTVHGFFGQVLPLLKRLQTFTPDRAALVQKRFADVLCKTAQEEDNCANWPVVLGTEARDPLLHYCHGAPGIVNSSCEFPTGIDDEVDRLIIAGGELIWQAGPLRKGSNLCHGTAGNGFAMLKLYQRTEDEVWLDRARQFAMHGIEQYRATHSEVGHARFSLWTGDLGLAIFLQACIDKDPRFPTIDVF